MADVNDALDLLTQVIAETAAREAQEKQDLQREIASLKSQLEAAEKLSILSELRLDEADRRDEAADVPSEPARYHGCYNLSKRRTPIKTAAETIAILGGPGHLSENIGVAAGTIGGWRDGNYLPKKFRGRIDELMKERGYHVDGLLYR
jgi:hypothetical protein